MKSPSWEISIEYAEKFSQDQLESQVQLLLCIMFESEIENIQNICGFTDSYHKT